MMMIFELSEELLFPPPVLARDDGLLAVGGDLSVQRLLLAYSMGIFPWYSEGDPLLWWSPDPRLVLIPGEFHCSRRLARTLRQDVFRVTFDQAFAQVIKGCAAPRSGRTGTWIVPEMQEAYIRLHEEGWAHSVECWLGEELVGGLYGVSLGGFFFGESMFSKVTNSSKVAFATLAAKLDGWDFDLVDCQMNTPHLVTLGGQEISGLDFSHRLQTSLQKPSRRGSWSPEG